MELPPPDLAAAGGGDSPWDRLPLRGRDIAGGSPSAASSAGVEPAMKDLTLCSTGKPTTPITGTPQELTTSIIKIKSYKTKKEKKAPLSLKILSGNASAAAETRSKSGGYSLPLSGLQQRPARVRMYVCIYRRRLVVSGRHLGVSQCPTGRWA
jgi:hypothetical protein